jgi:predicted DNA binding CopG/RHH family protein
MASPASNRPAERRARGGRVEFRASEEEIAALDDRAAAVGMDRSELLRALIFTARIRHRKDEVRRLGSSTE